jgi:phosphatidylglycerol:prolipoprotein diacylglycerol transferase
MTLTWELDPILIHITQTYGIRYYGLLFSLVFVGGFFLFRWQILRAGGRDDDAYALIVPGALGAVIGARLGHVFFYASDRFLEDPMWLFRIWEGGLASHGAVIGLAFALVYYSYRYKQSFLECVDRFVFSAALGATLVRVGNFLNSEIVGRVTDQTWGVRFPLWDGYGADIPLRHPSQLYEAFLGAMVFLACFIGDRLLGKENRPRGALTAIFMIVYFTGRFTVEFFKERHIISTDFPLSMGQMLSIPGLAIGAVIVILIMKNPTPAHWNVVAEEPAAKPKGPSSKSKKSGGKRKKKR